MRAMLIGSGSVGRGLIAPLLLKSGYRVLFVDVDTQVINSLRNRRYYPLASGTEFEWIGPVDAIYPPARMDETDGIGHVDVIFVSVRIQNFTKVASELTIMTSKIPEGTPIYVVENTTDGAGKLEKAMGVYGAHYQFRNGIANVIVPDSPYRFDDPVHTIKDPNMQLVLEKRVDDEFHKTVPIEYALYAGENDFTTEWDMKLHLHCALHYYVGVLGVMYGIKYVHDAITDPRTKDKVIEYATAIKDALIKKYPAYKYEIGERYKSELEDMSQEYLMDLNTRLIRDIERKIYPDDRIFGTAALLTEYNGSCLVMKDVVQFGLKDYSTKDILKIWEDYEYRQMELDALSVLLESPRHIK